MDALHERKGACIRENKLVLRLNKAIEIEIPPRALRWLNKRFAEKLDKKSVGFSKRNGELIVQSFT